MEHEKIDWKELDLHTPAPADDLRQRLTEQMGREIAKAYDRGFQAAAGMDTAKKIEELLIELRTLRADKERWKEFAEALDGMCVLYRTNALRQASRSTGKVVDRARAARAAIDAAKEHHGDAG